MYLYIYIYICVYVYIYIYILDAQVGAKAPTFARSFRSAGKSAFQLSGELKPSAFGAKALSLRS